MLPCVCHLNGRWFGLGWLSGLPMREAEDFGSKSQGLWCLPFDVLHSHAKAKTHCHYIRMRGVVGTDSSKVIIEPVGLHSKKKHVFEDQSYMVYARTKDSQFSSHPPYPSYES